MSVPVSAFPTAGAYATANVLGYPAASLATPCLGPHPPSTATPTSSPISSVPSPLTPSQRSVRPTTPPPSQIAAAGWAGAPPGSLFERLLDDVDLDHLG